MIAESSFSKLLKRIYFWLTVVFFVSLIVDVRFVVSVSTILLMAAAIACYRLNTRRWWNRNFLIAFTLGCFLYFLIQSLSLVFSSNIPFGISKWQTDLGLLALPVGVLYGNLIDYFCWRSLMKWYLSILLAATVYALIHAWSTYLQSHDSSVFFYHSLVRIYSGHAIQFSVLVFIAILFLIEEYAGQTNKKIRLGIGLLFIYFSVFLFLLTSKLVITIYFIYVLYVLLFTKEFLRRRSFRLSAAFLVMMAAFTVLVTNNPLKKRLTQEVNGSISFIRQDKFDPGDYFTGTQFRLVSWRFVYEILSKRHRWLFGVGIGDAQDVLDNKYRNEHMFIGGSPDNKTGYIGYHTHNQFLQALLETGVFGLLALLIICVGLIQIGLKSKSGSLMVFVLLLLCNCFTDAPLRTQYGIILFVFFPLFIFCGRQKASEPA